MSQVVSKVVDKVATTKSLKGGPKLWAEKENNPPKIFQKIFPAIQKKIQKKSISKSWRKKKQQKPPDFCCCFRDDPPV